VAGHRSLVVEPEELDYVAYIALALDLARSRPLRIGEDRVGHDPALLSQVGPNPLGKGKVGGVVTVQVTDFPTPELEGELASLAWACLDAWPGGDLLDDPLARCSWLVHDWLLEVSEMGMTPRYAPAGLKYQA
jgi:hypothetical protein